MALPRPTEAQKTIWVLQPFALCYGGASRRQGLLSARLCASEPPSLEGWGLRMTQEKGRAVQSLTEPAVGPSFSKEHV